MVFSSSAAQLAMTDPRDPLDPLDPLDPRDPLDLTAPGVPDAPGAQKVAAAQERVVHVAPVVPFL